MGYKKAPALKGTAAAFPSGKGTEAREEQAQNQSKQPGWCPLGSPAELRDTLLPSSWWSHYPAQRGLLLIGTNQVGGAAGSGSAVP